MSKHDVPTTLTVPIEATGKAILVLRGVHDAIAVDHELTAETHEPYHTEETIIVRGAIGGLYEGDSDVTPSDTARVDVNIAVHSEALRKRIEGVEGASLVRFEMSSYDHSIDGADDETVEFEFTLGKTTMAGDDVPLSTMDKPTVTGKPTMAGGLSDTEIKTFDVDPDVAEQTFERVQYELETARESGVDVTEIILGIPQYKALLVYAARRSETTVPPSTMLGIDVLTVPNPQIHVPRDNVRTLHEYDS